MRGFRKIQILIKRQMIKNKSIDNICAARCPATIYPENQTTVLRNDFIFYDK